MHHNNLVYKGYRLTAKVARANSTGKSAEESALPRFVATVLVTPADMVQVFGDDMTVPAFANGGFADNPRDAVHLAIAHGVDIVDALIGAAPHA